MNGAVRRDAGGRFGFWILDFGLIAVWGGAADTPIDAD
jgi:hypothetical protein